MILNERGFKSSISQTTIYSARTYYKTIEVSDEPILSCLFDQMKNDPNFAFKNSRYGVEKKDLTDINQVFESLKSFESSLNYDSTVQDLTKFFTKASKILQRTINIVNIKGGEQVFKFKSAKNVQAEPYHLCFVKIYDYVDYRGWLSITSKNVQNT